VRLFVALDIPVPVRAAIEALVAKLRPACPGARWVRLEGSHITLKFIGEVSAEKVEPIRSALAPIRSAAPIEMVFHGLGFFPHQGRPRVFWAGIEAGDVLGDLASAVEAALEPLGIPPERRAFSPHLTLARFESPRGLDGLREAIAAAGGLEFGRATATEFHLYQSVLKRGGAEYTRLATCRFVGGDAK
jgi:RNA 2',3'-cyclic 3'-phosphodiesterase